MQSVRVMCKGNAKCKGNCSSQEQSGAMHVRGLSGALYAKWTRPAPAGKVAAPLPSSTLLILRFEFKSWLKNEGMCKLERKLIVQRRFHLPYPAMFCFRRQCLVSSEDLCQKTPLSIFSCILSFPSATKIMLCELILHTAIPLKGQKYEARIVEGAPGWVRPSQSGGSGRLSWVSRGLPGRQPVASLNQLFASGSF